MASATAKQKVVWQPHPGPQRVFLSLAVDECLYGGARGGGKRLRLDEPLPTPTGWTTVGALQVGDALFDERGRVCQVTALFPIEPNPVAYRLTFDDGTTIEADAEHNWVTFDKHERAAVFRRTPEFRARRRASRASRALGNKSPAFVASITARNATSLRPAEKAPSTGTVRTTAEIARTLRDWRGAVVHSVPVAGALELPPADLPVDPYVLGLWLGDGHSQGGAFTSADAEIVAAFAEHFPVRHYSKYTYGTTGLATKLRALGLLKNKHIPARYLRASREQRMALLQGLMDTDGTVAKHSGAAEFTTTRKALADSVRELVVSLGWKVALREGVAKLNGRAIGPKWTLKWVASDFVFRLARKRTLQKLATSPRTRHRYIVACEPCAPSPMRCLTVDSPSHLFLAGPSMVPTHNTDCLLYGALRQVQNPNYRALILRRTFPELREVMDRALSMFKQLGGEWVASEKRFKFPSGATIEFGYCETFADALQFQGQEFTYVGYDEIGNLRDERAWDFLLSCVRSTDPTLVKMARCSANPGGVAHGWLKRRFIAQCPPDGTPVWFHFKLPDGREVWRTRAFVQAKVFDNPTLADNDPGYVANLMQLPEVMRKQHLEGDWEVGSGLAFERLREESHLVPLQQVPGWASCFAAFDWGYGHKWAFSVAYLTPGGKVHVIDSASGRKQIPEAIVERVRDVLKARGLNFSRLAYTVAGSDVKIRDEARGSFGPSVMEQFGNHGWFLMNADNSRVAGYQNLLRYIEHGLIEWEDTPGNRAVIQTLRDMVLDPDFPSDVLKVDADPITGDGGDDAYDMTRYLCMSRPLASVEPRDVTRGRDWSTFSRASKSQPFSGYTQPTGYALPSRTRSETI